MNFFGFEAFDKGIKTFAAGLDGACFDVIQSTWLMQTKIKSGFSHFALLIAHGRTQATNGCFAD